MEHLGLLTEAVERATVAGASYVEARYGRNQRELMVLKDGNVVSAGTGFDQGVGVRVLVDGAWGFAASSSFDAEVITALVQRAVEQARLSGNGHPVELAPHYPIRAEVVQVGDVDPLEVDHNTRVAALQAIHAELTGVPGVTATNTQMDIHRDYMELVTSEGTEIAHEWGVVGGGYVATAEGDGKRAKRSFPHHGGWDYSSAGFEWFESDWFQNSARRIGEEAVLLIGADDCPSAVTTVVLDPAMIGTTLHETVGHATELDRIIGDERDNFGASFVTVDRIGSFEYAAPIVSVVADATLPGGAGSYAFDAEGVPAQRVELITSGVLRHTLNSRECAAVVGEASNGTARASSWNRIPMARMTNLELQPGTDSLESLISGVDDGIYITTDAMTDIDDNRELCSFGGEIGWRIRGGELAEPIRRPFLYTDTHRILGGCDGIGSASESVVTGILGCGKGQPWQFIFTGQGGPPARFRDVEVGPPRSK